MLGAGIEFLGSDGAQLVSWEGWELEAGFVKRWHDRATIGMEMAQFTLLLLCIHGTLLTTLYSSRLHNDG